MNTHTLTQIRSKFSTTCSVSIFCHRFYKDIIAGMVSKLFLVSFGKVIKVKQVFCLGLLLKQKLPISFLSLNTVSS